MKRPYRRRPGNRGLQALPRLPPAAVETLIHGAPQLARPLSAGAEEARATLARAEAVLAQQQQENVTMQKPDRNARDLAAKYGLSQETALAVALLEAKRKAPPAPPSPAAASNPAAPLQLVLTTHNDGVTMPKPKTSNATANSQPSSDSGQLHHLMLDGDCTVSIETVTPEVADRMLSRNSVNRKLRNGQVEKLTEDMRHGRWTQCVHPICFYGEDDVLADGQHRLHAVMASETSQTFIILRGLKRTDGLNIDTGAPRNLVDAAQISGEDKALTLSLLSVARGFVTGDAPSGAKPLSNATRLEQVDTYREALDWAMQYGPRGRGLRNAPVLAAIARACFWETDKERLAQFGAVFTSGLTYHRDEDCAAVVLRNYFMTKKALLTSTVWRDTFLKTQNAIGYFMRRQPLTVIRQISEECYPLPGAARPGGMPARGMPMELVGRSDGKRASAK